MDNPIIFTEQSKDAIRAYNMGMTDVFNMTQAREILNHQGYHQMETALAGFVTGALENKLNEKFHNSLSELEKNGVIERATQEKIIAHERNVKTIKGAAAGSVVLICEAAPYVVDLIGNSLSRKNMSEFIIGWTSYINGEFDSETAALVNHFLQGCGIRLKGDIYQNYFEKYVNAPSQRMADLRLNRHTKMLLSGENLQIAAKKIVTFCDLSDDDKYDRALEFLVQCLGIRMNEAEKVMADCEATQELTSSMITFSAAGFVSAFLSVIKSVETAKQYAFYDMETDVYGKLRAERRQKINESVNGDVDALAKLSPTATKIYTAAGVAMKALNFHLDVDRFFQIDGIMMKMLEMLI